MAKFVFVLLALFGVLITNIAKARPDMGIEELKIKEPSLPPGAYMRFCKRYPAECELKTGTQNGKNRKDLLLELKKVNQSVNREIIPEALLPGIISDDWIIHPKSGDCDEYAVTKRHDLLQLGWPSSALRLAEVRTSSGEGHLILVVRLGNRNLVLDNLDEHIKAPSETTYHFIRVQSAYNPLYWDKIAP